MNKSHDTKWHASVRSFDIRRLSRQERAVETIEYIGLSAAMVALLGGVWVAFDRGGAQRVGAAVVHTTECWISQLSGELECAPLEDVAEAPPRPNPTPEPVPTPNWNCLLAAPGFRAGCPQEPVGEGHPIPAKEPPWGDDPLGWLISDWDPQALLDWLPEDQRGMLLGGAGGLSLLAILWALGLLGAGSALTTIGVGGLLASVFGGWLYGQLGGDFRNEVAFLSGVLGWLLGTLGLKGVRRGLGAFIQRRQGRKVRARPARQDPGPAVGVLGPLTGFALLEPTPLGELLLVTVFVLGGLGIGMNLSRSRGHPQERTHRESLAAEVRTLLAEGHSGEEQAVRPLGGEPAMPTGPSGGPESSGEHDPYEIARSGGKHSGTLRTYRARSTPEIQRALRSFENLVRLHQNKLVNPQVYARDWYSLTARQQQGLLEHWRQDLERAREYVAIMRGILQERGAIP